MNIFRILGNALVFFLSSKQRQIIRKQKQIRKQKRERKLPGPTYCAAHLAGPAGGPAHQALSCRLPPRASRRGRVPDARSYTPRPPPPSQPAWLLPVAPRQRHDTPSTPRPLPRTLSPSSVLPARTPPSPPLATTADTAIPATP